MILATPWVDDLRWLAVLYGLTFLGNDLAMGPAWAAAGDIGERHAGTLAGAMNMMASLMAALAAVVAGQFFHASALAEKAGDLDRPSPLHGPAVRHLRGQLLPRGPLLAQGGRDRDDPPGAGLTGPRPAGPGGHRRAARPLRPVRPDGPRHRRRAGPRPGHRPGPGPPRGRPRPGRPRPPGAEEVAAEVRALGRRASALECDVGDEAAVRRAVEATLAEFGRIDALVNNAGITKRIPLVDWTAGGLGGGDPDQPGRPLPDGPRGRPAHGRPPVREHRQRLGPGRAGSWAWAGGTRSTARPRGPSPP